MEQVQALARRLDRDPDPVLLDGGLAIELERAGFDPRGRLWTAAALLEAPEVLRAAHRAFAAAGAEILTTASYQLDDDLLRDRGLAEEEIPRIWRLALTLARASAGAQGLVACSLGPRGAVLGGGAEYRGDDGGVDASQRRRFHRRRLERALDAGATLLALETLPRRDEVEALLEGLAGTSRCEAWISVVTGKDGRLPDGTPLEEIARRADAAPAVAAVGVNCCHPDQVEGALAHLRRGTAKPFVVYPNSAETWRAGAWRGRPDPPDAARIGRWREAGARIIGGCCRVGARELARLRDAIRRSNGARG